MAFDGQVGVLPHFAEISQILCSVSFGVLGHSGIDAIEENN
jgi:hypothetical protein